MSSDNFLEVLAVTARADHDFQRRVELSRLIWELDDCLRALYLLPSVENMVALNGAWAVATALYDTIVFDGGDDDPQGSLRLTDEQKAA